LIWVNRVARDIDLGQGAGAGWRMMRHHLQGRPIMAYKSLLTVAASPEGVLSTVTAAAQIAQKMDAHLDALALGVDRTQVGYSYVGSGAVVIAAAMDRAEAEAREAEAALNAAIGAQTPIAALLGRIGRDAAWRADRCRGGPGALFRSGHPAPALWQVARGRGRGGDRGGACSREWRRC
jgi:hypothetical protein